MQKIGYKMSGTLRGEIWGLSFAVAHSEYTYRYEASISEHKGVNLIAKNPILSAN